MLVEEGGVIDNYGCLSIKGDIVLAPGTIDVYGNFINHNDIDLGTGNVYLCSISEAIVPIIPTQQEPTKLEERRQFSSPYDSKFVLTSAHTFINDGNVYNATIEIISNGLFGKLTILLQN